MLPHVATKDHITSSLVYGRSKDSLTTMSISQAVRLGCTNQHRIYSQCGEMKSVFSWDGDYTKYFCPRQLASYQWA